MLDVSDKHHREKKREVEAILEQLGVLQTPRILVLHKADLLTERSRNARLTQYAKEGGLVVSSKTGQGVEQVKRAIREAICTPKTTTS